MIMSYEMPFYENDNRQLKGQMIMEQTGADESTVASMLNDWKEENLDIDALLRASGAHTQTTHTGASPYQSDHQVPTFDGSSRRPNALDLTRTVKYEPRSCQEIENQIRANSASPHTSPYRATNVNGGTVFNYSNGMARPVASPMSPHHQATPTTSHSPYSPHSQVSPVSPHNMAAAMSPHSRSSSCSPVPSYMSAVFSRYADTSLDMNGYMGGYQSGSDMHGLKRMDKNSDNYRAKRERNNVAVRRSREKKKQREIENEVRVQELADENTKLQTRLDVVLKEMKLLKSLYQNIGVSLPQEAQVKIERELSKLSN